MDFDIYISSIIQKHPEFSVKEIYDLCDEYVSQFNNKTKEATKIKSLKRYLGKEFDIDFAMKLTKAVPYDPHYETDNVLAYSLVINYGGSVEGEKEDYIFSATATFVNLDGKVLFLFCYGLKEDIEWTRKASKVWVKTILAEN